MINKIDLECPIPMRARATCPGGVWDAARDIPASMPPRKVALMPMRHFEASARFRRMIGPAEVSPVRFGWIPIEI